MTKAGFDPRPKPVRIKGRQRWLVDCRPWPALMKAMGEPRRRNFPSLEAATAWCQDLIIHHKVGRKPGTPEATVSAFIDSYLKSRERSHLRPHTTRMYGYALRKSFLPFLREAGALYLDQIQPATIDEYRQLLVATMAPSTVRTYMAVLKGAFGWGLALKLFDSNPVVGLVPPEPRRESRPLTDDERQAILTRAPHRDLWLAYTLTGLRAHELADLPVASVHLDTPAPYLEVVGKGRKKRNVPLAGPEAVAHFRQLVAAAHKRGDTMLAPWRVGSLQAKWREDRDRLGLDQSITIHTFRHTYGRFMAYRDLIGTQRAMGHADIKTTMRYVLPDDRPMREAAAQWGAELHTAAQPDVTESAPDPDRARSGGQNG